MRLHRDQAIKKGHFLKRPYTGESLEVMTGDISDLLAAASLFVFGHFILSSAPVRGKLVSLLGAGFFQAAYSVSIAGAMVWMIIAYGNAPFVEVWVPPEWGRKVTFFFAIFGIALAFIGVTSRSPTAVGGGVAPEGPARPVSGILTVTRHPFLIGASLWAIGHLCANGALADLILFGGILVLCLGGAFHIDARRSDSLGAAWGPISLTTSVLPFCAVLQGRTKIDWRGIGFLRPIVGLAVALAIAHGHAWIFGVSVMG